MLIIALVIIKQYIMMKYAITQFAPLNTSYLLKQHLTQ